MNSPPVLLLALLCLSTRWEPSVLAQQAQGVCGTTDPKAVQYGNSVTLQCPGPSSWWRSKTCDDTPSFESYATCLPGHSECLVPVDGYEAGYYYFCCALPNIPTLTVPAVSKCFKISICTMVTRSSAHSYALNGTTEKVYVDITAEPLPSDDLVSIQLNGQSTELENASLTLGSGPNYTKVYEFRVPGDTDAVLLGFCVKYSTSDNCNLPSTHTSVNEEFEIKKTQGSLLMENCPTAPSDVITDSTLVSLPTPTPALVDTPRCESSDDDDDDKFIIHVGVAILIVLFLFCVCCGGLALAGWARSCRLCRLRWWRKEVISSTYESPYDISPNGKVTYRQPIPDFPHSSSGTTDSMDSPSADV